MDANETRRLLGLAAKAAGIEFARADDISLDGRRAWVKPGILWQPFDDDGDSRRLEVALCIDLEYSVALAYARATSFLPVGSINPTDVFSVVEDYKAHSGDVAAAARLAVLRAAAAIGERMEKTRCCA